MTDMRIIDSVSLSTSRSLQRSTESMSHYLLIIFSSTPGQIQPEYGRSQMDFKIVHTPDSMEVR